MMACSQVARLRWQSDTTINNIDARSAILASEIVIFDVVIDGVPSFCLGTYRKNLNYRG